jgi:hypothetical protein
MNPIFPTPCAVQSDWAIQTHWVQTHWVQTHWNWKRGVLVSAVITRRAGAGIPGH